METGNAKFREFGELWLYHPYWNKFAETAAPTNASGVHAYSHVNTFSSAAMAYAVTGDEKYLRIIRNAYDFLQNTQTYATGGYGPVERIMPAGSLGTALEFQPNSFEAPCGSWAAFKLSRYLTQFTGDARYGDWAERLLYNGIGGIAADQRRRAALLLCGLSGRRGREDFQPERVHVLLRHLHSGHRRFSEPDLLQGRPRALCESVCAFGSDVEAAGRRSDVAAGDTISRGGDITMTLRMAKPRQFGLRMRVPGWSRDVSVKINGAAAQVECKPGNVGDREPHVEQRRPGGGADSPAVSMVGGGRAASAAGGGGARSGRAGAGRQRPRADLQTAGERRRFE